MRHYMTPEEERKFLLSMGERPEECACDVCGETHYRGKGYYPLQKVNGYEMFCCKICRDGNWDGWNPRHEEKILAHLKAKGVNPPRRNADGLLPFEFRA